LRIIQAMGNNCHIHVKGSIFASNFFRKFYRLLEARTVSYFRFSDPVVYYCGRTAARGFNFNFISEYSSVLSRVITDNAWIAAYDRERLDTLHNKIWTLYARCPTLASFKNGWRPPTHRLMWASRLDSEMRPELIAAIAQAMSSNKLNITIDVYGSAVLDKFDVGALDNFGNVRYKGKFDDFAKLKYVDYDAFLYTTRFDGLPNVILEAMAAGLPVIAPDVGGISEAVSAETGFLIENSPDDDVLVERFLGAIKALYDGTSDLAELGRNAQRLIQERHSEEAYLKRLDEVFSFDDKLNRSTPQLNGRVASSGEQVP
jgi:glycosyltransferase involved in cell wall biosynthesis